MADEPPNEEAEEVAKKKKKKKMMIGGLAVAGLAYQFVLKSPPPPEEGAEATEVEIIEGEVAPIEEMVVNLADQDQIHYIRLGVAAVLEEGIAIADIEPQLPKVQDVVIDIVSQKTFAELRAAGATVALKEELSTAARAAFDDAKIVRIIFTTFVMQ